MGEFDAAWYRARAADASEHGADNEADLLDTVADLLDGTLAADLRRYGLNEAAAHVERLVGQTEVGRG